MTLATTALALYHRTKAQYLQLTHPTPLFPPDHNHPQHPLTITFQTHRTTTTTTRHRRRRPRPLTKAIRHLLTAYQPTPLPPPSPTPPAPKQPPCRLCAATTTRPSPTRRRPK